VKWFLLGPDGMILDMLRADRFSKGGEMFSLKKYAAKRALRKNVNHIKSAVKRSYREISRDLSKRASKVRMPVRVTISR